MRLFRIANPYTQMRSDYNHEVLATEREPEGQPRRARGDDEASVARSAARGAIGIITRPNIAKRSKSDRTRLAIRTLFSSNSRYIIMKKS